jgi:alkanesulfonate monooxygenase SsuD/methylene tetrahydromethanopterin reductase-like flavin-dependent oxidoreductase (luciferase family)
MPYLPPAAVADRLARLAAACEKLGRDPAEIETSVNVGFYLGSRTPDVNPEGSLVGSAQQAVDRIGEYVDSGVQGLNIALRPPVDWEALQTFTDDVLVHFQN